MPAQKRSTKQDEKVAPIQVRGLPIPDVPKRIIANEIRSRIDRGVYPPGEMLPSLTTLEEMTGVARGTIRAAISILSEEGYVRSVIGAGTFVLPAEYWGHPENLPDRLS
jgi:DNA-binding GntR family transcriptional regulator